MRLLWNLPWRLAQRESVKTQGSSSATLIALSSALQTKKKNADVGLGPSPCPSGHLSGQHHHHGPHVTGERQGGLALAGRELVRKGQSWNEGH